MSPAARPAQQHSHPQAGALASAKPKLYNPRHPEHTLLYRTVAEHFETWLDLASCGQFDGQGDHHTPRSYFRKYLECGIFAHGFARARCDACGHDYFVVFSCKGRGVCPSCNTRRIVETAAHLTDHVFPRLPVRQCVLSVPKRLRYFMQRDGAVLNMVLRIFLRVIEQSLSAHCPGSAQVDKAALHIGAVASIHRFGSSLNAHVHFHVCVVDGVFEVVPGEADVDAQATAPSVVFHQASGIDEVAVAKAQTDLRRRILRAFVGRGLIGSCDAKEMLAYQHSGFSVDAGVRIEAHDRAALERLLRYCARPPFACARLRKEGAALVYRCAKRASVTGMALALTAPAQQAAAGVARQGNAGQTQPDPAPPQRSPAHYLWAVLIARFYEVFPLMCPICGGQMRLIAFITEGAQIRQILDHIGVDSQAPRISPARGPPLWEDCDTQMGEGRNRAGLGSGGATCT